MGYKKILVTSMVKAARSKAQLSTITLAFALASALYLYSGTLQSNTSQTLHVNGTITSQNGTVAVKNSTLTVVTDRTLSILARIFIVGAPLFPMLVDVFSAGISSKNYGPIMFPELDSEYAKLLQRPQTSRNRQCREELGDTLRGLQPQLQNGNVDKTRLMAFLNDLERCENS